MRGKVSKILSLKFVFLFGIFMLTISNSLHTSINNILSKNIFNKECLKPIFAEKDISDSIAIRLDSFLKRIEFNGSILVEFKNEVVYYRNFGFRKLPKKMLINDSTSFQIASISKQFTAVAIMMLKER